MRAHANDTDDELHDELSQLGVVMIYSVYGSGPKHGHIC